MIALMDNQPITPGHALVGLREHVASFIDLPAERAGQLMRVAQCIDRAIRRSALRCEAVTLFHSDGGAAGQVVNHVHPHILPRFEGDGFVMRLDYSYQYKLNRDQLDRTASEIRRCCP